MEIQFTCIHCTIDWVGHVSCYSCTVAHHKWEQKPKQGTSKLSVLLKHHGAARVTLVKLLKPRDTLVLSQAYRLITVAEVTKALQAKEEEKTRRAQQQLLQQVVQTKHAGGRTGSGDDSQSQQVADGSLDQVLLLLLSKPRH